VSVPLDQTTDLLFAGPEEPNPLESESPIDAIDRGKVPP
jgi:hypothetical protein